MTNLTPQMSVKEYLAQKHRKPSKYRNVKVETADGTFDSKREYNRWCELKIHEHVGAIAELQRQVKYTLQVPAEGGAQIICTYIADFVYKCDGKTVVEDSKGYRTKEYKLKKKLMLAIHGIEIKEV
ncbi:MAG TPA: DUF1064 domain-containing protein [Chitinophagales bacterium]|nr:DUF1064 domain-containing protein [Chitinophagales bacterium]